MKSDNRAKMKRIAGILIVGFFLAPATLLAQKFDEERMKRDIEVAENVLATLIKQQFNNQRTFFPLEVRGSYQSGYGVTFALPADFTTPIVLNLSTGNDNLFISGGSVQNRGNVFEYENDEPQDERTMKLEDRNKKKRRMDMDSIRNEYNNKVIVAARNFIADYGDMITQLEPNERIVITNQANQPRAWVSQYFNSPKRTHLSIEGTKSDISQFRQGKFSREQMVSRIKVVNTETVDEVEADLELLVTMFNRLYSVDLSKTYFTENNIYYERLKDFGAIYYMHVVSTVQIDYDRFQMPTVGLDNVDIETRNKKVKEIYPQFEKELKENILEYGRTIKSLKENEVLVFQVKVTKCPQCGIPSTIEYTVKSNVLSDFNAGKMDRNAALNKISLKKGTEQ
jgi:hypothetical protein